MANGDTTRLTIELEVILRRLNQTLRGLDQVKRKLDAISNIRTGTQQAQASNRATLTAQRHALALQRLQIQQQRVQQQQARLAVQAQSLATAQQRAALAAQRLTQAQQRLTSGAAGQFRALRQVQRQMNSLGAAALRIGGGLRSFGASMAILVTGPLTALGTVAARSAADIDAIRNRLIATEGSLEAANQRLSDLRRLADSTVGVTRRTALDTFAILATLGDVTDETINRQIRAFGRLNAAFTIEDQQTFFRNLLQIFQQGFEIRDIREALGRVPIFNTLLESAFGTSDPERLRELKAAGKLTLDTFLAGMATAVETDPVLGNIQESIRVRFEKTFERLSDALEPLGRAILGPLERIVVAIEPIILRIAAAFEKLPPGVQTAIVAVGVLTAAIGPLLFILGGLASGLGFLFTIVSQVAALIGTIGLPAVLSILAGLTIVIGQLTVAIIAFGVAWQKNFLGIRKLAGDAANAIIAAINRIRAIINETTQRILPTLQSITTKVLGGATRIWETYGKTVVDVIRTSFQFVTGVIEVFTRTFGNFIDLVLKLVDGDWRGAWRAFARIIVPAVDTVLALLPKLIRVVQSGLARLVVLIVRQAVRFADAATQLAGQFIGSLVIQLVLGAPKVRDALITMMLTSILSINFSGIAAIFVGRFIAALKRAAAEEETKPQQEPTVGVDVGSFNRRRRRRGPPTETEDEKADKRLRRELDKLREAQDKLAEIREQGTLEQLRSRIETEFTAAKNGLDRELSVLEANFDERLVAIRRYLKERQELQEAQIDREIQRELELTSTLFTELFARRRQAEKEFQTELREIAEDPKLKGQARAAAIQTAETKKATENEKTRVEFAIKHEESLARQLELEKQRKQVGEDLLRFERELTRQIALQQDQLRADLFDEQGRTADAAVIRLRAQFTETLRDLRIDISGLGQELQAAITDVDLSALRAQLEQLPEPVRVLVELLDIGIRRARITELAQFVENLSTGLRLDEFRIQNKVLDGLINQREAQAQIVELQRQYKGQLLDVLKGELAKAEAIKDQALILSLQQQIAETERLGTAIDEVGQQINQALFQDLQSGLAGIFSGARRGFEGLRDAAISFGERLLDTLNDIAATSIVEQLRDVFKPDATNTEGTIGGFISKLFGLAPKVNPATVANTTATVTNTAATAAQTAATIANTAALLGGTIAGAAGGGLGSVLGSALGAATGLFPAVPGGVYRVLEGGYPEAVLTTDPRHASRQAAILRAFLKETKGLGGRIKSFAAGAFISPHEAQSMMLSGLSSPPMSNPEIGGLAIAGTPSMMRLRQVLVDQRSYRDWINSSEGEQVLVDFLHRKAPVIRNIGGKR